MKVALRVVWAGAALLAIMQLGGCPQTTNPLEYIAGGTGSSTVLRDKPLVEVLTPVSNLSIGGGTQVEVNWRAFARTRTTVINVIIDVDQDPNNGNEISAYSNLNLDQTSALVDTTSLAQGAYYIGVELEEVGRVVAYDYAPGVVTIDQRPYLYFTEPRGNIQIDRTQAIVQHFTVAWSLSDPDSTDTVEIFIDPDDIPNGNEVFLYHSTSQTTDTFEFDLPTADFAAGTWRLLAIVSDGRNSFSFYAPGSIRLRARIAGYFDLRDLDLADSLMQGMVLEGFNPHDNLGSFLTSMGDVDGDGFNDLFAMAQFAKPYYEYNQQRTGTGEAYLIYGRSERFVGHVNANSTGTLFRGDIFLGVQEAAEPIRPSRGITSFTLLSDWDQDGVREFAFGVPFTDSVGRWALDQNGYFRTGGVIVCAGSSLRPDLGFPGRHVLPLADFGTAPHLPVKALVQNQCPEGFYGPKAPTSAWFHQHLYDYGGSPSAGGATLGCRFSSAVFDDQFGESVTSWDFDALIIAAPNRDPYACVVNATQSVPGAGVVSVFFDYADGGFYPWTNGNSPPANAAFNYPGSQQSAGDRILPHGGPYHYVLDDLAYEPGYYVDLDDNARPNCNPTIDAHLSGHLRIWSNQAGARLTNVKSVGDVSADGLLDLMIGSPLANDGAGATYIVFGRLRALVDGGELLIDEIGLPMTGRQRIFDGIRIVGAPGDRLGESQDYCGDFNHDGYGDVVIGSPMLNNRQGGAAVFFGSRTVGNLTETELPFAELAARGLGVNFVGESEGDMAGARVAAAGDIDGDGNADILIAAPHKSVRMDIDGDGVIDIDRADCGVIYLVYGAPDLARRSTPDGQPGVLNLKYIGTEALPGLAFIGRSSGDELGAGTGEQSDRSFGVAGVGDVDGDGIGDLLFGAVNASPRDRLRAGEAYLIYGVGDR
jgi:hypothetical protein